LEAQAASGAVVLSGVAHSPAVADAALQITREIPGVSSVKGEIQVVREFNVMP
jgi:osmotically-inducible protein OsmY